LSRDERTRTLLELRSMLKARIDKLERELVKLRSMLDALDEALLEITITTADRVAPTSWPRVAEAVEKEPLPEVASVTPEKEMPVGEEGAPIEEIEVKSAGRSVGKILLNRGGGILVLEVAEGVKIPFDLPPLRWLEGRLRKLVDRFPNAVYNVETDEGGMLKGIVVKGAPPKELVKLSGEVRWALDRAYRKP